MSEEIETDAAGETGPEQSKEGVEKTPEEILTAFKRALEVVFTERARLIDEKIGTTESARKRANATEARLTNSAHGALIRSSVIYLCVNLVGQ